MSETVQISVDELQRLIREAVREEVGHLLQSDPDDGPLSLDETAEAIGVSTRTVRRMIDRKKIRPLRIGRRVLVPRTQVDGLLRNGK